MHANLGRPFDRVAVSSGRDAGCAGNGSGLDANGQPLAPGSGSGGPPPLSADFKSIQANIFMPICSVCHVGGGAPEGLRLDAANSYNLLVGVPSTEVPSLLRVKPGDPDNSYIIQKLEGHAAVGAQMPIGGPYLSSSTIAFIRQWTINGVYTDVTLIPDRLGLYVDEQIAPNGSQNEEAYVHYGSTANQGFYFKGGQFYYF